MRYNVNSGSTKGSAKMLIIRFRHIALSAIVCCLVCIIPPLDCATLNGDDSMAGAADTSDICLDSGTPTVLQCSCEPDEYDIRSVHCTVADRISPDDSLWSSFRSRNVRLEYFTLKARRPEFLQELPLEVARHSPHLEEFTVQRSGVTYVPSHAFRNGSTIKQIDLDANLIAELRPWAIAFLPALQVLSLNENQLDAVRQGALVNLPQLKELYLVSNLIDRLDDNAFEGLARLTTLDLARNRLGPHLNVAAFNGLTRLQHLDLSSNRLRHLSANNFKPLTSLHTLIMRHNRLSTIDGGSFVGLTRLLKLHLSKNELLWLHDRTLRSVRQLIYLDLSSNNLTTLTEATFSPLDLRHNNQTYVNVAGNPFQCDCRLRWMLDLAKLRSNSPTNSWSTVTCSVPPGKRGDTWNETTTDGDDVQSDSRQPSDNVQIDGKPDRVLLTDAVKFVDVEQCPLQQQQYISQTDPAPTLRLSGASSGSIRFSCQFLFTVALVSLAVLWV